MIYVTILKLVDFSYKLIESQLLPFATAWGEYFHAFVLDAQPTLTSPIESEMHLKSSQGSVVELFSRNS